MEFNNLRLNGQALELADYIEAQIKPDLEVWESAVNIDKPVDYISTIAVTGAYLEGFLKVRALKNMRPSKEVANEFLGNVHRAWELYLERHQSEWEDRRHLLMQFVSKHQYVCQAVEEVVVEETGGTWVSLDDSEPF